MLILCLIHPLAQAYDLDVSPSRRLNLKNSEWQFGSGNFSPNSPILKVFSHTQSNTHQIIFEDLFLPAASLIERLPKDCLFLVSPTKIGSDYCKWVDKSNVTTKKSITLTSIMKLTKKNVSHVRSVHIMGSDEEINKLLAQLSEKENKKGLKK